MRIIMRHYKILSQSFGLKIFTLLLALSCLPAFADTTNTTNNAPVTFSPGPKDGRIAYITARLLEDYHYLQQPLDTEMSKKFYDEYLDALDPQRMHFLQSDIAEFVHYRTNLDKLTINDEGSADLTPAYQIFRRFSERLHQHVTYVDELLKQDKFKFNSNEQILIDRHDAPYPKDLAEAKQIWRKKLLYDFMQEKINRELSTTNDDDVKALSKSDLADIADTLRRRYDRELRAVDESDNTDLLQVYLDALAHAYDPHSDYFNNAHAQDFSITMSLALFGIGAQLVDKDGYCTINSLVPGGPAEKGKQLKENDRIIAVAQSNQPPVDVVDMKLDKVVQLIRGPKGTEVRLTVTHADDPGTHHIISLVRDEIKLEDQEAKAQLIEIPDGKGGTNRLGVIDLPSFYAPVDLSGNGDHSTPKYTSVDVAKLVKKLKQENVSGIIIDLRNNGGGSLEEAIKFVGLFIKEGPVVLVRSPEGRTVVDSDNDPSQLYHGPLIVLVNRFSASASEIAAAALQDYGRALIVGDTSTHGKGTVQDLNPLRPFIRQKIESPTNDPGAVKITIRKFYRVSGASTQLKGVTPDIILPDRLSYLDGIGESSLDNPLSWDTIHAADYDKLNLIEPYLTELEKLSDARVATNKDFNYIREDIAELQKLQTNKTISLNEHVELKRREELKARQKARIDELASRKVSDIKIYNITVENADKPGLPTPEPMTITNSVSDDSSLTNTAAKIDSKLDIKPAPTDPMLDETERILEDYILLLNTKSSLIAK
ncbi:MAG TPA: carboxy terminal-processing peptidase [Verrucomicrobiae bacterium]|nr:carboxy terminal-processing peptidase [Verrucomicrobiae bacterium]